jgi:intein/homing endonuclease
MKLITEHTEELEYLAEDVDGQRRHMIEGIFAQAEMANRNGRVYPRDVLENAVNKYNETQVSKGRAVGELGHPECFHENTEALTKSGWKKIKDIEIGEKVYTLNKKGFVEYQEVKGTYKEPYQGEMYHFKGRTIDTVVTPNHRFLTINRKGKYEYIEAQDLFENEYRHHKIVKSSNGVPEIEGNRVIEVGNKEYDIDDFCYFLGFWLAEGCVQKRKDRPNNYHVYLHQNDGIIADKIKDLLDRMGLKYTVRDKKSSKNPHHIFVISDMGLANYLTQFGTCSEKYIDPHVINALDAKSASHLLEGFVDGDGRGTVNKKYVRCDMFSTSERLIDELMAVSSIAGIATRKFYVDTEKDYKFAGRIIKKSNKNRLYFARFIQTSGVYIDKRFLKIEKLHNYDDKVYCLTVDNSNFLVRDGDGKQQYTFWTGNSPTVNLDRVSHRITELRWDGDNVIGRAQVLDTPMGQIVKGLMEGEVQLGVSTRGMGSLQERGGKTYVKDDFMLATVDVVQDPSAPEAFVNGIMEGVEYFVDNGTIKAQQIDQYNKEIRTIPESRVADAQMKFFKDLLNSF